MSTNINFFKIQQTLTANYGITEDRKLFVWGVDLYSKGKEIGFTPNDIKTSLGKGEDFFEIRTELIISVPLLLNFFETIKIKNLFSGTRSVIVVTNENKLMGFYFFFKNYIFFVYFKLKN